MSNFLLDLLQQKNKNSDSKDNFLQLLNTQQSQNNIPTNNFNSNYSLNQNHSLNQNYSLNQNNGIKLF